MTPFLAREDETNPLQGHSDLSSTQVSRKFGYQAGTVTSTNSRPNSVGTGSPASTQSSI